MICLCCGKKLDLNKTQSGWHKSCIKNFFGTTELPEIEIDEKALELLALESTTKGFTVPGVQKKLSLHLFSEGNNPRLTLVNYPTGYILKPQVKEYESLPEAEQLVMCMADAAGITTVPHALIMGNGKLAYITKRVDRIFEKDSMKMLAMEDFCQLDLRLTQDKYKGSYERCAKIIDKYSSHRGLDMTELFLRLIFSFIVGNSDMHLKNFSLLETAEGSGNYVLSPAYDLLPVNVILPEDPEQFALAMNGKKRNLRKKDFLIFAASCGLSQNAAEKMIKKMINLKETFTDMCNSSLLPKHLKSDFLQLMNERIQTLNI